MSGSCCEHEQAHAVVKLSAPQTGKPEHNLHRTCLAFTAATPLFSTLQGNKWNEHIPRCMN